jgi:hypothetical protein
VAASKDHFAIADTFPCSDVAGSVHRRNSKLAALARHDCRRIGDTLCDMFCSQESR